MNELNESDGLPMLCWLTSLDPIHILEGYVHTVLALTTLWGVCRDTRVLSRLSSSSLLTLHLSLKVISLTRRARGSTPTSKSQTIFLFWKDLIVRKSKQEKLILDCWFIQFLILKPQHHHSISCCQNNKAGGASPEEADSRNKLCTWCRSDS
jgi:hypothetical protein